MPFFDSQITLATIIIYLYLVLLRSGKISVG